MSARLAPARAARAARAPLALLAFVALPALASLVWTRGVAAQECRPPTDSHEAKLLAFYSAPMSFSPLGAPERRRPGSVVLGVEVSPVPVPPPGLERTSFCYNGKVAQTRLAAAFPRPRVVVALPAGLALEGSYLPPVTVADAQPNLGSVALSYARVVRGDAAGGPLSGAGARALVTLMLRAQGTFGRVRGPITCPTSSLQLGDPGEPCFGREASRDTFHPDMAGLEGALAVRRPSGRLALYGGGGVTRLAPHFQVGFRNAEGALDTTRVTVSLTRASVFGGAAFRVLPAADLSAQLYAVPEDAVTWRFAASYRVR